MKKLLIIFLAFSTFFAWSQESHKLKLQSGIYKLPKADLVIQLVPLENEVVGNVYYRILQFKEIPNSNEKNVMEAMGIDFLYYLPENAFIASIKTSNSIDVEYLEDKLESIAPMSASMKLSKLVWEQNFPEYAIDGNDVKIVALVYDGLELDVIKPFLAQVSAKYNCQFEYFNNDPRLEVTVRQEGIADVASLPFVYHVQTCEAPAEPENHRGVSNHRVNAVSGIFPGSYSLTGAGVVVGHGDDGDIGPHIDYRGRLTSIAGPSNGNHGDHVAGTIFGAGNLDPNARGMAPGAEIYYSSYPTNINSIDNHYTLQAVRITSSSYGNGCNAGYTSYSQTMDKDIRDNYALMHVFSCGNSGNSDCNYGAGSGWGNITGGHKQGKNVIATGSVSYQDVISGFSSRGPADDGRIKPDMCAIGSNVYSCNAGNVYNNSSGTSMACPGVSGSLALMHEYYKSQYTLDPPGGLLKSILMNTAEDLGNSGPDFTHGYGRINVLRAIETLENENFIIDTISQGDQDSLLIQVPSGIKELRVMVYWSDKEANPSAAQALVNNLDMTVWDLNNQTQYKPWVLDPTPTAANLNATAVRDVDSLNNVEQVTLMNPGTGYYRVDVTGTSVPFASQEYYIVYYLVEDEVRITHPFGGEFWDPTETQTIRWDAIPGTGTFDLDYSLDSGQTWMSITTGISANQTNYDWNPADQLVSAHSFVRITRGASSSMNQHSFHFMQAPSSLKFDWICGDSARMSWPPVLGATQYVVYQLGNKYMEPIDTFGNSYGILNGLSVNSKYWLSVSALGVDDVRSKRAFAIAKKINFQDCILPVDAGVSMVFQNEYALSSCQNLDSLSVTVSVKNYGADPIFSIPVNYKINSTTTFTETLADTIRSYDSAFYTFNQKYGLTGVGNNFVQGFTSLVGDSNLSNDFSSAVNFIHTSGTITLPDTQTFNGMSNCGTSSNCGWTVCNLTGGWINDEGDDTDWRVNSGSTPTIGTGPTSGYMGSGKYVYLEAGNCFGSEARMVTPCINLDSTTYPEVVFAYHMFGNTVGSLHLDVIVDGKIEYDIMPVLSGEQDSNWLTKQVYLTPYVGKTINLQFRGIIGNGNSSDIALDEIIVREANLTIPVSQFSMTPDPACYLKPILFTSTVSTVITDYKWDFGMGSTPSSAIGEGPHTVVYAMNSNPVASLKVSNILGTDSASMAVTFDSIPTAGFTFTTIATQTIQFTDQSSSNSKSWLWSFGDGNTSTVQNPTHVYQNGGDYDVTLYAINDCGQDSLLVNLYVTGLGVDENRTIDDLLVYPNPVDDVLIIERDARNSGFIQIDLWDAMGRELQTHDWNRGSQIRIDMSRYSPGVYIVKINQGVSKSVRIIKN